MYRFLRKYYYWWETEEFQLDFSVFRPRIGFNMVPAIGLMHYSFFAEKLDKA